MSLGQLNISGLDRVQVAIERLRNFEPADGYFLAFSGGKDSVVIKALADMAGVKYDAHYNVTTVDPPELVRFIVKKHQDVALDKPDLNMWQLIVKKRIPPTRIARYCCEALKEGNGKGRFVVTGVRKQESAKRSHRAGLEFGSGKRRDGFDPDNPNQGMIHRCSQYSKRILNPIIDWSDVDVWEFIRNNNLPYCSLYDEGFKRLGCIGCPMAKNQRIAEFERWPGYKRQYLKAFDLMLQERLIAGLPTSWSTGQEVFDWWMEQ